MPGIGAMENDSWIVKCLCKDYVFGEVAEVDARCLVLAQHDLNSE